MGRLDRKRNGKNKGLVSQKPTGKEGKEQTRKVSSKFRTFFQRASSRFIRFGLKVAMAFLDSCFVCISMVFHYYLENLYGVMIIFGGFVRLCSFLESMGDCCCLLSESAVG